MNTRNINILAVLIIILLHSCTESSSPVLDLNGDWTVVLDSLDVGIEESWASQELEGRTLQLPGTLDDAGIGTPSTLEPAMNNYVLSGLTRKHQYIGPAWYQKEISIPADWKGKNISLELERVIWGSTLFLDGKRIGDDASLITPHKYELGADVTTGRHLLTIRIDNSNLFPLINVKGNRYPDTINQDMAHAYTNHTQIKWNGVIGDLKLSKTSGKAVRNLQVYANVVDNEIKATFENSNANSAELKYQIQETDGTVVAEGMVEPGSNTIILSKPQGIKVWDEFNPNLYTFRVYEGDEETKVNFGYSQVSRDGSTLMLNGKRIYLRGNLECAIFPLTGHPPMEKSEWATLLKQAKDYGLNHLRFHSWCPPKAAFQAADEAGFYLQVELPHWSLRFGEDPGTMEFLIDEANRMFREYGNHPSFIFMALGNELQGDADLMNSMTMELKKKDPRHLYMTTAYSFQYPLGVIAQPADDYFVTQKTDKGWVRGQGIFNEKAPHFDEDYTSTSAHVPVPLISHEIGQYSVYPDMSEIEKYTGVLKPLNFVAIRNELEKKGLLELAADFTHASGKLATMLYKEEIERALKTPSFDGFQLLQLQDFPGQGTALVGLLNAFWESKGVVSAKEFRRFNSEVVPLIRYEKAVYENGENFTASMEIANFYEEMMDQVLEWVITDDSGAEVARGSQGNIDLKIGNNPNLGMISHDLKIKNASRFNVELRLKGTDYVNDWSFWVYPREVSVASETVVITQSLLEARQELAAGKTVLYNPDYKDLKGIDGRFVPVFWSPVHFPNQPSSMGLLIDEEHPAFADFPTSSHTEWQWWDLCIRSKSVVTDSLNVTPLVRVIDNFVTNHHLANVFETKVGDGKLVFSSIDLSSDLDVRPVARQLRSSLLKYMESSEFNPSGSIGTEQLDMRNQQRGEKFNTTDIYND